MKKIAIFASGNGSNAEAIIKATMEGKLSAKVMVIICDNKKAFVLERAKKFSIDTFVFDPKDFEKKSEYETKIIEVLDKLNIDLICLAGYMRIIGKTLLESYEKRIINIHPALLPAFKGAHGIEDAFNYGVKVFGVTVHFVDKGIDSGKIIMQRSFEYYGSDIEEVEKMIHAIEHVLYVEAINKIIEGM